MQNHIFDYSTDEVAISTNYSLGFFQQNVRRATLSFIHCKHLAAAVVDRTNTECRCNEMAGPLASTV